MPNVSIDDVIEVRLNQRLASQRIMTILHYACTAGGGIDMGTLFTSLHTQMTDPVLGPANLLTQCQSDSVTSLWIDYQVIKPTRQVYVRKTWSTFGNIANDALPPGNSVAVTKQGTIAGKGLTGHVLFAGAPTNKVTDGNLVGTYRTTEVQAFADTLPVVFNTGSTLLKPIIGTTKWFGAYNFIESAFGEMTVRTMSRRVVGRGI